jgi:hypothetical protein
MVDLNKELQEQNIRLRNCAEILSDINAKLYAKLDAILGVIQISEDPPSKTIDAIGDILKQ